MFLTLGVTLQYVKINIKNRGIRIADDKLGENMWNGKRGSNTKSFSGSGQGLRGCKILVDAMGGQIGGYNNEDGPGSTFWVIFPVNLNPEAVSDDGQPPVAQEECLNRILIVEDTPMTLSTQFRRYSRTFPGVPIDIAITGEEAIKKCEGINYSLISMDNGLPGISGFEATTHILERQRSTGRRKSVVLTHSANPSGWEAAGIDGFLTHATTPVQLARQLSDLGLKTPSMPPVQPKKRIKPKKPPAELSGEDSPLLVQEPVAFPVFLPDPSPTMSDLSQLSSRRSAGNSSFLSGLSQLGGSLELVPEGDPIENSRKTLFAGPFGIGDSLRAPL